MCRLGAGQSKLAYPCFKPDVILFLHLWSTFRCTYPSSLSTLLPHLDAGDGEEEYVEDGAFDLDDMYWARAAPSQPFCEDGVHLRWKFMRFFF